MRVGLHHFAHLRAVAEGVPLVESAQRYLCIDHGRQALTAHRQVVDHLRSLARRRGDKGWRLVGLTIRTGGLDVPAPSLEDFVAERDLDGFSEAEVLALYAEAYPPDARAQRRRRLREQQLALLRALEQVAAEVPALTDRIDGWLEPTLAARLAQSGILLLQDLQARIALGGVWWRGVPAVGKLKAARLVHWLQTLLPPVPLPGAHFAEVARAAEVLPPVAAVHGLPAPGRGAVGSDLALPAGSGADGRPQRTLFDGRPVTQGVPGSAALTGARSDAEVIEAWVAARSGAATTARSYRKEALRLLLWLQGERQQRRFQDMQVEDCLAYMSFMEHVPPAWMSRRYSTVLGEGWAPFRGPLSLASRRQAVVILGSFFGWMVDVGYLPGRNPWHLVNRQMGDDPRQHVLDSRAFTPQAWEAVLGHLHRQPPSPSRDRILFILAFVEATGLRAAELVGARVEHMRRHRGRWAMQVHGKGARNRVIAVPGQALEALTLYLAARGLPVLEEADPKTPLLARLEEPLEPIGYQALYQTMKRWVREAILGSDLPRLEREDALRASPHWLRHTFGTRALERQAPLEVVQRQLGHADPRTTMRYAKAQLERLQAEMDAAFGGAGPSQPGESRGAERPSALPDGEVGGAD
ncbi:tyrosine-type recombinase/integrase [Ideonella livida]|nr:site-specific integrase [Ideonella livida]